MALPAPIHMLLKDRKAYALRAAYFKAIRANANAVGKIPEEALRYLENRINEIAQNIAQKDSSSQLDDFLAEAVEAAEKSLRPMIELATSAAISPIMTALRGQISRIKCIACYHGAVCHGLPADDEIVASTDGGECINEIKSAFRTANETAARVYSNIPSVRIQIHTSGFRDRPALIPGIPLALNGQTRFADTANEKISVITIEIASTLFDEMALVSVPYVVLHEVFCHGYQMANSSRPRRNAKSVADPISEGMMDVLAARIMEQRASELAGTDDWQRSKEEADAASQIHLARRSLTMQPRFPQASTVALGVHAWDLVLAVFSAEGDSLRAEQDARRLACDLNLHDWDFVMRFSALSRFVGQLKKPRNAKLVTELTRYRDTYNSSELINYLTIS